MPVTQLIESVQYLTMPTGERNAVVVDIEIWEELVRLLKNSTFNEQDEESTLNRAMWREEMAYRRLHPALYEKYADQYVAIHDEQLVDHDCDQLELYLRIRQQYGEAFVLMTQVQKEAEAVYSFRSPHITKTTKNILHSIGQDESVRKPV